MKISLNNKILDEIDMSYYNPTATFSCKSGIDHYRLLAFLSTLFEDATLVDIGTRSGASAIALAKNSKNKVHSFDINDCGAGAYENVEYHVCDILKCEEYIELVISSSIISLDIDHEGTYERDFLSFLRSKNYKGILYMDDINTDLFPNLRDVWKEITEQKFDVTRYGHFSGSGLVMFDPTVELVME